MPKGHRNTVADLWRFVSQGEHCWEWTGARDNDGYGIFALNGGTVRAHRLSWVIHNGIIPAGLHVLHQCDNPPCVRPEHLWLGTSLDNTLDRHAKGRDAKGDDSGPRKRTSWKPARGETHGRSKLTEIQVIEIKRALNGGAVGRHLAKQYGVDPMTISFIRRGVHWSHVVV